MLSTEGFVGATRYAADDGDGFFCIYELDVDPETARANLAARRAQSPMTAPVGLQLDPPPVVRYFTVRD
jgi:hypothetical protein